MMISAKEAAKATIAAVRERNVLNEFENLILEAAKVGEHTLYVPLAKLNELVGDLEPCDFGIPGRHPIPLRLAWAEMHRNGFVLAFNQRGDSWYLDISWKSNIAF
jgi:hypothetical protein